MIVFHNELSVVDKGKLVFELLSPRKCVATRALVKKTLTIFCMKFDTSQDNTFTSRRILEEDMQAKFIATFCFG